MDTSAMLATSAVLTLVASLELLVIRFGGRLASRQEQPVAPGSESQGRRQGRQT